MAEKFTLRDAQLGIENLNNGQNAILAAIKELAAGRVASPAQVTTAEVQTDSAPQSVLAIQDNADRPAVESVKIDKGEARQAPAGTFRLRKSSSSGGGNVDWTGKRGKTGVASCPAYDDSSRKVSVKVKDPDTGVTKSVEKTLNLDDYTRGIVGPLLQDQYKTVIDTEETHRSRGAKSIRLAQIDDDGKVIAGTTSTLLFGTAESGSFMLRGELTVKATVKDATGKGTVVFTPVARGEMYLMGKDFVRHDQQS